MSKFVKLRLDDGREVAYPVSDIRCVCEPLPDDASEEFKTGCVFILFFGDPEVAWIIGTVDSVLAAIRDAEKDALLGGEKMGAEARKALLELMEDAYEEDRSGNHEDSIESVLRAIERRFVLTTKETAS